jgi:regulator of protease activity HflC (stomatin/prohibitin superfamily)
VSAQPIPGAGAEFDGHGAAFWVVIGAIAVVLLIGSFLRVVPEHQRVVVSRFGKVVRVGGPGLSLRIPGVERLTTVSLHPVDLPLVVSTSTRDGVPVRLIATAVCRITDPALSTLASPDPLTAATAALENTLGRQTARTDLAGLLPSRERLESSAPRDAATITGTWGVEVVELRVTDIETRLTTDLLRSVHRRTEPSDR